MGILEKIFGNPYQREIKKLQKIVEKINNLEDDFVKLKDSDFPQKTAEFKERISKGESLDDILPEAFAAVREAAKRTLGQRHFDVQLMGGIVLHQGKIAEMKTGEGKTLVATLPAYLNALSGKGVHIVTVNDYLAKRDTQWMGSIYDFLGLKVGCIQHDKAYIFEKSGPINLYGEANLKQVERKEAYLADITYGTNNEFGFDYLRDNMVYDLSEKVQRELNYAILDEIDSILIDEARTPLIISAPAEESAELYKTFARLVPSLKPDIDYKVDEKARAVTLTEEGIAKVEKWLSVGNLYEEGRIDLTYHLEQALKAHVLFKRDKDYVVKDGEVIIVDEFTGRLMYGRRYSEGLHQAIEAKEGVEVKKESRTLATITFQNYFRLYEKLAGMTGTAATEAEEFHKIYKLDVVVIPTHRPMIRKDLEDMIYKNEEAKFKAVVEEIKKYHKEGRPVLVGTISIEKNEYLGNLLLKNGIPCQILNAKNHEKEAQIIANAGKKGAVTVATNMAGRGVDIILGGALPPEPTEEEIKKWEKEHQEVVELGGLHIIGTERHESRRIDNQLRGRAGRQGDPGSSQFFVSLEDDLMRIFGGERIKNLMERLNLPDDQPIFHPLITKSIENAQKKVEAHNFDIRKHLLEYDDVLNKQREKIYNQRRQILEIYEQGKGGNFAEFKKFVSGFIEEEIKQIINNYLPEDKDFWDVDSFINAIENIFPLGNQEKEKIYQAKNKEEIEEFVLSLASKKYEEKEKEIGVESFAFLAKILLLRTFDALWVDYLDAIDHLRAGIGLRGYAQKDPLVEFKYEAHRMFQGLLAEIASRFTATIYKIQPAAPQKPTSNQSKNLVFSHGQARPVGQVIKKQKVGRNDPCPCGSGKKYKKCCGR